MPFSIRASNMVSRPALAWLVRRLSPGARVAAIVLVLLAGPLVWPKAFAPFDPAQISPAEIFQPPSRTHWFGTDQYGRDLLSRLVYGTRTSMSLGLASVSISLAVSLPLGIAVGFYRGTFEAVVMRLLDILMSFPGILLALVVITMLGRGLLNAMIAVGIGQAPAYTRVVRSAVLSIRELAYIEAARAAGARNGRILWRHILPNIAAPVIVIATVGFALAIIIGASLGFLGLGAQPPTAEWGTMISEGRAYLRSQWWIPAFPGLTIGLVVLAFNLLGDALRDLLDPRLRS
jgi:peptide/nickel transport system permease protein